MFVLGVPKVLSEDVNKIFRQKVYPQPKVGKSQEISGIGLLTIFLVKGKNPIGGGG